MPRKGVENLLPVRTKDEARAKGKNGGKASGAARRHKKLMSQIYAEFLAEQFKVKVDGSEQTMTGEKLINRVVKQVLISGGSPAVSLMKEIREATEGSKTALTGANGEDLLKAFADAADAKVRKTADLKEPEL